MPRLTIDPAGTHLLRDGHRFPLIIETVWSAFADPTIEEWRVYLGARRRQGFTAVLITQVLISWWFRVAKPKKLPIL